MNHVDYFKLGGLLKQGRESSKLTQKEIAQELDITPQTVSTWENGKNKIDMDTLYYLCNRYGLAFTDILDSVTNDKKRAPLAEAAQKEPSKDDDLKFFETLFVSLGLMEPGGDISPRDRDFINSWIALINAYLQQRGE